MTVQQLIDKLKTLPRKAEVEIEFPEYVGAKFLTRPVMDARHVLAGVVTLYLPDKVWNPAKPEPMKPAASRVLAMVPRVNCWRLTIYPNAGEPLTFHYHLFQGALMHLEGANRKLMASQPWVEWIDSDGKPDGVNHLLSPMEEAIYV